jgi:hypothetical protein
MRGKTVRAGLALPGDGPASSSATDPASEIDNAHFEGLLDRSVLPPSARDDALHVAIAVVSRQDILVSWNFRHLVNRRRRLHMLRAILAVESGNASIDEILGSVTVP